jgi:hypothetical protein
MRVIRGVCWRRPTSENVTLRLRILQYKKLRRECLRQLFITRIATLCTLLKTLSVIIFSRPVPQGADPYLLPLHVATSGKNHLYDEITPLLPTGKGERCNQTISNLGHAALLRRCELPL